MEPKPTRRPGRPFEGGAQPVREFPPDQPGAGRTIAFTITVILGLLTLIMPVLWGIGIITTLGPVLGNRGLALYWVAWGIVFVAFLWSLWAMWRRAA